MILRPAIIGLALSLVIVTALIAFSNTANAPFFAPPNDHASMSGEKLPPVLFPMFPEYGFRKVEEMKEPTTPKIKIRKAPKTREVSPGNSVTFALSVENTGTISLKDLIVEDRFDGNSLSVKAAPGGAITINKIMWSIPLLEPKQLWTVNYVFDVIINSESGNFETTAHVLGDDVLDEPSSLRMATSSITVIALPSTGVELNWWMKMLSELIQYVRIIE